MPFASVANTSVPSTVPATEPRPPSERGAADDDGGDGVELEQVALVPGVTPLTRAASEHAGDRGEHAEDHVDAERRAA